jgi:hypothetical protein
MAKSQLSKYKRVRRAADVQDRHSTRRGRIQNNQRKLPPKVAAMFNELVSRSLRVAEENQKLHRATAEANAKFRQEQAKLMDSLAQHLGLSGVLRDLAALRERRVGVVRDAIEKTQKAIAREQRTSENLRKSKR